jgi:hypothetical protein
MKETIINISDKIYLVQIAETEERETGLSKTEKLDQDSGCRRCCAEALSEYAKHKG